MRLRGEVEQRESQEETALLLCNLIYFVTQRSSMFSFLEKKPFTIVVVVVVVLFILEVGEGGGEGGRVKE